MEVGRRWPENAMWKDANAFTQLESRDTRHEIQDTHTDSYLIEVAAV